MRIAATPSGTILALVFAGAVWAQPSQLNIEIDYMVLSGPGGHSHQPQAVEIAAIVQMFACHGITLNIVVDDPVPHVNVLQCASTTQNFWTCTGTGTFASYKSQYFDHTGGGWHYCLFGHDYDIGQGTGSSGIAQVGGADFAVTLGSFAAQVGTAFDRAATLAHEFGHNLGLVHAGQNSQSPVGNYQPNYASIMSYQYQLSGLQSHMECIGLAGTTSLLKQIDYSNGRLPALDENALDEWRGIGLHTIDWNCNGSLDPAAVAQDLDGNSWCGKNGAKTLLRDYDDWSNIRDGAIAGSEGPFETISCITAAERARQIEAALAEGSTCFSPQPNLAVEPCVPGLMIWMDPSYAGPETGTGEQPFNTLGEAATAAPAGSIIYLQPGWDTNGGMPLAITKAMMLAGPGGAVVSP